MRVLCYISLLFITCSVFGQSAEVVVTKTARSKNPTLAFRNWSSSPELLQRFQQDIIYSDWFGLVQSEDADYILEGRAELAGASGTRVSISVIAKNGRNFQISHTAQRPDWLVHQMVDAIIAKAFNNPGFCSTRLAYVKADGGTKDIWVGQFDGSGAIPVTQNRSITTEPNWSHDNKYMSYTLYTPTATQIILYDLHNKRWRRLAHFPGLNSGCALANRSMRAAMSLSKDGQVDLYTRDLIDAAPSRLTRDTAVEASPCWSPNDDKICYVGSNSSRPTLFFIPSRGGAPERVLNELVEAVSPDWSSVSNQICFAMRRGGQQYTIGVIDMTGSSREIKQPISIDGDWEAPSWCADGRHLICSRTYGGETSLYLVDTWYGKARELTKCGNNVSLPACSSSFIR